MNTTPKAHLLVLALLVSTPIAIGCSSSGASPSTSATAVTPAQPVLQEARRHHRRRWTGGWWLVIRSAGAGGTSVSTVATAGAGATGGTGGQGAGPAGGNPETGGPTARWHSKIGGTPGPAAPLNQGALLPPVGEVLLVEECPGGTTATAVCPPWRLDRSGRHHRSGGTTATGGAGTLGWSQYTTTSSYMTRRESSPGAQRSSRQVQWPLLLVWQPASRDRPGCLHVFRSGPLDHKGVIAKLPKDANRMDVLTTIRQEMGDVLEVHWQRCLLGNIYRGRS